jgi:hypothetical protein
VPRTAAERRAAAASGQLRRTGRAVLTAVRSQLTICHACSSNVCRQLETNSYCLVWHMINERMDGWLCRRRSRSRSRTSPGSRRLRTKRSPRSSRHASDRCGDHTCFTAASFHASYLLARVSCGSLFCSASFRFAQPFRPSSAYVAVLSPILGDGGEEGG